MKKIILTEHQLRLWRDMIRFIDMYQKEDVDFPQLVVSLESALDAGEFKDEALVKEWYRFWTPLEIDRAVALNTEEETRREEVQKDIEEMRQFLMDQVE